MPADANVFQSLIQPVRSVADYQDDLDQRDALRTRNALQALTLRQQADQFEQGTRRRNALEQVAAGIKPNATPEERASAYASNPYTMDVADQIRKAELDRRKTDAEINDKTADTASKGYKLTQEKRQDAIRRLVAFSSPQDAIADLNASVQRGEIGMAEAQAMAQRVPQDAAQFGQWQLQNLRGLMSPEQAFNATKPVLGTRDNGGTLENITTDPLTGRVTVTASTKKVATPDAQLQASTTMRGQDMTAATARAGQAETNRHNQVIEGAKKPPDAAQKIADAKDVLDLLEQARPLIAASTGSYTGAGLDALAQGVGLSTPGAQAAAQLKALEGALVSKMPKMSGPQSDKDVLLYRQMAGQIGDPTVPPETKLAAMETIREINRRSAGLPPDFKPRLSTKPTAITDDAGYNALPSGALFTGPDGKTRRKP